MSKHLKIILFLLSSFVVTEVSSQTVYTTKTGEKYHKKTCHYLKYSRIEVDLKDAKQFGYTACSVCKPKLKTLSPNKGLQSNKPAPIKTRKSNTSVQCSGTTKAGKRCKRRTKSPNGKCYQH